jgi:hypothetical protein
VHQQDSATAIALTGAIDQAAQSLSSPNPELYQEIQRYVGFHLFKNRAQKTCTPAKPPDFHQLLGLLNTYPALLRPLGLAFDFAAASLSGTPPAGQVLASTPNLSVTGIQFVPLETVCTSAAEFIAASRPQPPSTADAPRPSDTLHSGRFLRLQLKVGDAPLFSLVTEDTDGSSHKLTQQKAAADRSSEYKPSTPPPDNGLDLPDPTQQVPSARTTGVALYSMDRANMLASAIQNTPDKDATTHAPLYIEDLTLGYRVDIQNVTQSPPGPWMSLHERETSYEIDGRVFKPSGSALVADEGFMTLLATQTQINSNSPANATVSGADTQLQVHQSLMGWTGWSLSVPLPKSKGDDPEKKTTPQPSCSDHDTKIPVRPTIKLKPDAQLPRLQFDQKYGARLRHVDLAGNSVPVNTAPASGAALAMQEDFSRHEPVRAPQILVEKPIDRIQHPGEHADRMVLRDHSEASTRMLVPAREPLRMAILHGFADMSSLPPSAFPDLQLTDKGSFPSVAEASKEGFIKKELDDNSENQDAIYVPA